jgi:hypothetical protein
MNNEKANNANDEARMREYATIECMKIYEIALEDS